MKIRKLYNVLVIGGIADVLAQRFRREDLIPSSARARFVDPGVTQDAEHPTRQACVGSELLGPR